MSLILTRITLQNLGLESVGVKMNKNGAIEVVLFLSWRLFCFIFCFLVLFKLICIFFLPDCFFRLMNTHVLLYPPFGL